MLSAYKIIDVQMSTPSRVRLLRGHTLILNCTATTALNTRVQMTWSYPGEVSDPYFYLFCRIIFILSKWNATEFLQWEKSEYAESFGSLSQ